uniref:Uncharacterized protein n=1 Tax=Rhizophora mucronata TaxID=61149 RepID=A0A2P2Q9L5_RHIMU
MTITLEVDGHLKPLNGFEGKCWKVQIPTYHKFFNYQKGQFPVATSNMSLVSNVNPCQTTLFYLH